MTVTTKPGVKRPVLADTKFSAFGSGTLKRLKQKRERRERAAAWLLHLETEHEKRMAELNQQLEEAEAVEWHPEVVADDPERHTKLYLRVRKMAQAVPQGELQLWANDICWKAGISDHERGHFTDEYIFVKAVNLVATTIQRTWRLHRHVKQMKEERLRFVNFMNAMEKGSWNWGSIPSSEHNILPLLASIANGQRTPRTARHTDSGDSELARQPTWESTWEKFSGARSVSLPSRLRDKPVELPSLTTGKSMSARNGRDPSQLVSQETHDDSRSVQAGVGRGSVQTTTHWGQALNDLKIKPKSSVVGLGNYNPPTPKQSPRKYVAPGALPKLKPPSAEKPSVPRKKSMPKKPQYGGRQLMNPVMF